MHVVGLSLAAAPSAPFRGTPGGPFQHASESPIRPPRNPPLSRSARANALAASSACSRVAEVSRSAIILRRRRN